MTELDRALLSRLRGVFDDPAEHQRYLAAGWRRTEIIASLVGRLHAAGARRVLELGSNPYFLTLLMRRRYDFDLELANYFGTELGQGRYTHRAELDGEPVEFRTRTSTSRPSASRTKTALSTPSSSARSSSTCWWTPTARWPRWPACSARAGSS